MAAKGLGKGFEALIPTDFDQSILLDEKDRIQKLFISEIKPGREQPRKHFDDTALSELAESVKRFGVLQPLIVAPSVNGGYQLIAGERRWRAAELAGLKQVPAIVRDIVEHEQLEVALIENVQRVDLSPIEQAVSIERLHQQFNLAYADIAVRLGKAATTVNNIVRLLQLPTEARAALELGDITEGHARAILALKHFPAKQAELLQLIIKNGWSVRQAEQFANTSKSGVEDTKAVRQKMATQTAETKQLSKSLSTPVTLKHTAHGGRLEIHFKDEDQLKKLLDRLSQL